MRSVVAVAAILVLAGGACAAEISNPNEGKTVIAVAPLIDGVATCEGKVEQMPEACRATLEEALLKTGRFNVVAREVAEQFLNKELTNQLMSGNFDPSTTAAVSKRLGAKFLALGTVVENSFTQKGAGGLLGGLVGVYQQTMRIGVQLKMAEVETGSYIASETVAVTKKGTSAVVLVVGGAVDLKNAKDIRVQAINELAALLVTKISAWIPIAGKVLSVEGAGQKGDTVYVDLGSGAGIAKDMCLKVKRQKEVGGGKMFSTGVGVIRITEVDAEASQATIIECSKPVEEGDKVVYEAPAPAPPPPKR